MCYSSGTAAYSAPKTYQIIVVRVGGVGLYTSFTYISMLKFIGGCDHFRTLFYPEAGM